MPPERDLESALGWLDYAEGDLASAETLAEGQGRPNVICFLCQQSAEKAYKAYLAWLGDTSIPKVHDLDLLARRIGTEAQEALPALPEADDLTDYVITGRYPGLQPIGADEVQPALAMARDVLAWVRRAIGLQEGR